MHNRHYLKRIGFSYLIEMDYVTNTVLSLVNYETFSHLPMAAFHKFAVGFSCFIRYSDFIHNLKYILKIPYL